MLNRMCALEDKPHYCVAPMTVIRLEELFIIVTLGKSNRIAVPHILIFVPSVTIWS